MTPRLLESDVPSSCSQPVYEGKPAIRAYVTETLKIPEFKIQWVSEKPVFSTDGTMAYMRGAIDVSAPGPTGAVESMLMSGYTVWRRDPDGEWRCTVDIATEPPPATHKSESV